MKSFASYLKEEKLANLISVLMETLESGQVNFTSSFAHDTPNQISETIKASLINFLNMLEAHGASRPPTLDLEFWKINELLLHSSRPLSLSDLMLIYEVQKSAIFSFIPEYTRDSSLALEVVLGLEYYYKDIHKQALDILHNVQREEQQKVIESEERYRDLFDNASDLIHIATPEGIIVYVNNAWQKAIGYTEDELKGKPVDSFIVESERSRFREYRSRVIAGGLPIKEIETSFVSKDGKDVVVEGSISCKYKDGQLVYTRGILRNITTRKVNERKLQFYTEQLIEREENIRQLIQNAPDAVVVIDVKSIILLWNPKAEEIFGWTSVEVIGTDLADTIIPIQYRKLHKQGMNRLLMTGEAKVLNKTIEITALTKQGNEFFISLTISRGRQRGESIFIAFIRDISEQKKNQLELDRKRKQLEKTNLELEQFAWVTSHDLKEPLRKILTFSDILLTRHEVNSQVSQIIEKINDSAKRMNELIKGILLYSNISEERKMFELTDLNLILKNVLSDLEVSIAEKNAQIKIEPLPTIEAVAFQMRQLFQNVLSNSLKYSRPGAESSIDISSKPYDQYNVEISIKDNGIGFDPAYNEKIFQIFQRLSNQQSAEGTGIGLALCKKIVDTHGGKITARGNKAEGATFSIILPYKLRNDDLDQ
jgi:PAS domain S-box-containing protein